MEHTPIRGALRPIVFQDGLGQRRRIVDSAGIERLEVLCLRNELTSIASFEASLRERADRLIGFRHGYFAGIRTVDRLRDPAATLVVVAEPVSGVRLSEVLATAERHGLVLDSGAAWYLIRQLVSAVATFHRLAPDMAHGAIAPERVVVKADARLVVVEHAMGSALERVRFSRERYWKELRVACPPSAGLPELDQRADITQVGLVALALILGRPLRDDEYPSAVEEVVASAWTAYAARDREPAPAGFQTWLARALQFDSRSSFTSAIEASSEFDRVLGESGSILAPVELERFLARARECTVPRARVADTHSGQSGAPEIPVPRPPAPQESAASKPELEQGGAQPVPVVAGTDEQAGEDAEEDEETEFDGMNVFGHVRGWRRTAVAAVVLMALAGVGAAGARRYFVVPAAHGRTGALVDEPGASAALASTRSPVGQLQVRAEPAGSAAPVGGPEPGTVAESAPPLGWVVVSASQDVQVSEDGRLLGTNQDPRIEMPAGMHRLELVNEAVGYRSTRVVRVVKGKGSSIKVELPTGSIALNAMPWAEVWIDGEKVGETPMGNVPVSVGPHEIVFRNPDLGEQREQTVVTLGAPIRLSVDMRKK